MPHYKSPLQRVPTACCRLGFPRLFLFCFGSGMDSKLMSGAAIVSSFAMKEETTGALDFNFSLEFIDKKVQNESHIKARYGLAG